MVELKAWQVARKKVGKKIRKQVWDDMEVKGMSIKGILKGLTVRNYPLVALSEEQVEDLEVVREERRLAIQVQKLTRDKTNRIGSANTNTTGEKGGAPSGQDTTPNAKNTVSGNQPGR